MRYTLATHPPRVIPFDRCFADVYPVRPRQELGPVIDLTAWLGPARDQNIPAEGECSAESGAGIMDWLCRRYRQELFFGSSQGLYQVERTLAGDLHQDAGARLRQTQTALQTVGVWDNALDPDIRSDFIVTVTPAMRASAAQHRIQDGLWCLTLDEILNALAHPTCPVVVQLGIVVYPGFEAPLTRHTGHVPMPSPGEQPLGGHAVIAIGADLQEEVIYCRNSWGAYYDAALRDASHANFALPFAYLQDARTFLSARAYYL